MTAPAEYGDMTRIPCEGSGYRVHQVGLVGVCSMCGEVVSMCGRVAVAHDRDDILRAIDDGIV